MKTQTYDEIETNEPAIQAKALIEEILPLMQDYFIGQFSFDGQAIVYCLPNGQCFKITAHEA